MLFGYIKLPCKGRSKMEHLTLFVKGFFALAILSVAFSSIYIYRVWSKDTDRQVKIGIMGFTIELGPNENEK